MKSRIWVFIWLVMLIVLMVASPATLAMAAGSGASGGTPAGRLRSSPASGASPSVDPLTTGYGLLPSPVTVTLEHPYPGGEAYFQVTVTNGGILNGTYKGWCADQDYAVFAGWPFPNTIVYQDYATVPTSVIDYPENLDRVNWILNQHFVGKPSPGGLGPYTYADVQRAIWSYLDNGPNFYGATDYLQQRVDEITAGALSYGGGYVPTCGVMAVVMSPGPTLQTVLIELPLACIGDYVWEDKDVDGTQNDGPTGVENVEVKLYNCETGALVGTEFTDAAGYYLFDALKPGSYRLEFTAPSGFKFTLQNVGDDALDSDVDEFGKTVCTTLAPEEKDLTWDAGLYQANCDLVVNAYCVVEPPAPANLLCSTAIVATTLRYTGPTMLGATVVIDPDRGATVTYSNVDLISGETVLTMPSENGFTIDARPESDLGAKTAIYVNGVAEVIHTSCSTPYRAGMPAPLDNPKGNPSPNWFVVNFVDKDSPDVVAEPEPPDPTEDCQIAPLEAPSCDTAGKPTSLTFRWTGGGCAAMDHTQELGKVTCSGGVNDLLPVTVTSSNAGYSITPNVISLGQEFTVSASSFSTDSYLTLTDTAGGIQYLKIHTSCSQPLVVGDVYGGLTLVGFNGQRADAKVMYLYEVTNRGTALTNVTLTDAFGVVATFDLPAGESLQFQREVTIEGETTNTVTASGLLVDRSVCEASDTTNVTVEEPEEFCAVCKGGTTALTFKYLGTNSPNVVIYDDPSIKPDKILFQGTVPADGLISIAPRPGQDKFNTDISIYVKGVFQGKLNTSCSQPIGPGLRVGSFEIVAARSKDNGPMCPLDTCVPNAAATLQFGDREVRWNITNTGDLGLKITKIGISWPAGNGYLDEIKRDGDVIHKGNFAGPTADITGGWYNTAGKRTIGIGQTDTIKFKFQNPASTQGIYIITMEFAYGCSVSVVYEPSATGTWKCTKPIDSITMIWDGAPDTILVTAWKGVAGASTKLTDKQPVSRGQKITVSGYAGSPNDVYWELFDMTGAALGQSTFHLSCSDENMNGGEDCGKRQGDGKDKIGFINDWILAGVKDAGGELICP